MYLGRCLIYVCWKPKIWFSSAFDVLKLMFYNPIINSKIDPQCVESSYALQKNWWLLIGAAFMKPFCLEFLGRLTGELIGSCSLLHEPL